MRGLWLRLALVAAVATIGAGCAVQSETVARPRTVVVRDRGDIGMFYDALSPYGHWFEYRDYGWVWTPYDVGADWRPYRDGHWAYSDCGWTWVADEQWGWAPYHYGRWLFDDEYGWIWVPDTEWAPAWVAWRWDDDYVGWAPLPPRARWDGGLRYDYVDTDLPPHFWCIVVRVDLVNAHVHDRMLPPERNVVFFKGAAVHADYEARGNRPFNPGPDIDAWERTSHHPVPRFKLEDAAAPGRPNSSGGALHVYRPELRPVDTHAMPAPPRAATPAPAPPDDAARRAKQAQDQRQLQNWYDQHQRQMQTRHQAEETHPPAGRSPDEIRQQHQDEQAALDRQRARQQHVIQSRYEKGIVRTKPGKPAKPNAPDKPVQPDRPDHHDNGPGGH